MSLSASSRVSYQPHFPLKQQKQSQGFKCEAEDKIEEEDNDNE